VLRIIDSVNVQQAKWYYTHGLRHEHLDQSLGLYYGAEQEFIGQWCGQGAVRLGLAGKVDQAAFEALCENRDPATGQRLTPRTKSNRRVGFDFNFHCPKSVSVAQALTGDDRIVDAFRQSVAETMTEMEAEAKTRVRRKGADEDRATGNLTWGGIYPLHRPAGSGPSRSPLARPLLCVQHHLG
jgi:conjugative relaxase-like TrwC/TraI family protein